LREDVLELQKAGARAQFLQGPIDPVVVRMSGRVLHGAEEGVRRWMDPPERSQ
jgi:hypothetical protein